MMRAEQFVKTFGPKEEERKLIRFAKIAPGYESGKPQLLFDGESVVTLKRYPHLESYSPVEGDAVMVVHGVIIGKIVR